MKQKKTTITNFISLTNPLGKGTFYTEEIFADNIEAYDVNNKKKLIKNFVKLTKPFSGSDYYREVEFPDDIEELKDFIIDECDFWISNCFEGGETFQLSEDNYLSDISYEEKYNLERLESFFEYLY